MELASRIQEHLLGTADPNVIHLAGWSGIGKTRTALNACLEESGLEGVLYFPTLESFTAEAEDYLARSEGIRAAVVIDEVEISDWSDLRARAAHLADRIRIVTIGSGTKEGVSLRDGVILVPTDAFEILCVSVDVGSSGEPRQELRYLGEYFGKPEADFDRVIVQAMGCGLGRQQGRFFEPEPGALVRRLFERRSWPRLRPTASKFIGGMPTLRMQKRFVERGHECNAAVREEIREALTSWFHERFPSYEIGLLLDRQSSRVSPPDLKRGNLSQHSPSCPCGRALGRASGE